MRSSPEDHTEAGWAPAGTNEATIAASPPMRFTRKRAERRKGSLNVSIPAAIVCLTPHSPSMSLMLARAMGSAPSCAVMEPASAWLKR